MKTQFKSDIYEAMDILKAIEAPYFESYYEETGISDYKKKPYGFFLFTRVFGLKKSKGGKLSFHNTKDIVEIKGNTHKELSEKLEKIVDACEGVVINTDKDWMPEKWKNIKKAIKVFNLGQ